MELTVITLVFLLAYALLFVYYWRGWKSLRVTEPASDVPPGVFISVIVPARNEEINIPVLLRALQQQTYPSGSFEVIVADDFSTDNTTTEVKVFPMKNLTVVQPVGDACSTSKKKAIDEGVRHSRGELIVCTDADCIPQPEWLQRIGELYKTTDANFIAAPVKFSCNNKLVETFQALDFLTLQGITAASVGSGFHSMCNGANLAYRKTSFNEVNGFEGVDHIATGDDMLLMYKIWRKAPDRVFYLKQKEAIVTTQPMKSWKDFFSQRKRWASKSLVYDDKRITMVLAFIYLFNLLFIALLIFSFVDPVYWWVVAGFWLTKTIIELPFVYSVARFYDETKLVKWLFILQPLHIFYTVLTGLYSQFGKYEWKGRITK